VHPAKGVQALSFSCAGELLRKDCHQMKWWMVALINLGLLALGWLMLSSILASPVMIGGH
jgi:hypothetical protein